MPKSRILLRRASHDLTGLPPTPEEVDAFLADDLPRTPTSDARSPARLAGLRGALGRHWLDVVRYADTAGDNSDFPIPQMVRYRNWVIAAFNRDMPYDQFVRAAARRRPDAHGRRARGDASRSSPPATSPMRAGSARAWTIIRGT